MKKLPLSKNIIVSDYQLKSITPVFRNTTNTGKTNIKSQNYQIYEGSVELCCFGYEATKTLASFFQSLQGGVVPVDLHLPIFKSVNTIYGTPTLGGHYKKPTPYIVIDNFTGLLSAGDYFNIQNDPKLYTLITGGKAGDVFEISPSLRTEQPAGARVSFSPVLRVRLADDDFDIKPNKTINSLKIEIKFKEDL